MAPGRSFSNRKSDSATSRWNFFRPSAESSARIRLRLFWLYAAKRTPAGSTDEPRSDRPPGGSTLITSAPRSARVIGPMAASPVVRSSTRYADNIDGLGDESHQPVESAHEL